MKTSERLRPTIDELKALLAYDPETGIVTYRVKRYTRNAGAPAGSIDGIYLRVGINRRDYKLHRVAWALHYGEWPSLEIDHINGVGTDNRIANLRNVTHAQNLKNCKIPKNNTTGLKGVFYCKRDKTWSAKIRVDYQTKCLGTFRTKEEAAQAYEAGSIRYHGEFRRAG
jgi:hypothetical protein